MLQFEESIEKIVTKNNSNSKSNQKEQNRSKAARSNVAVINVQLAPRVKTARSEVKNHRNIHSIVSKCFGNPRKGTGGRSFS